MNFFFCSNIILFSTVIFLVFLFFEISFEKFESSFSIFNSLLVLICIESFKSLLLLLIKSNKQIELDSSLEFGFCFNNSSFDIYIVHYFFFT